MPAARLSMRKIKEVLRLKLSCGLTFSQIAASCGIGRSTVAEYLRRANAVGLQWPLPEDWDDDHLEAVLFRLDGPQPAGTRTLPDWPEIHQALKIKGVTLSLLWEEYKAAHPDGYQYSQFCFHYRKWARLLDLVMRQEHKAGEKCFVDYSGPTVAITDRRTGEIRQAQIFVAVLGASNYTYAEATWTQQLSDWIESHVRAVTFFGGVPHVFVPDNLKTGVSHACRYEPDLNPTYHEFARYYGSAIVPTRAQRPKDKAKVEAGVLLVERWILARLRKRPFFSLGELNAAIAALLTELNRQPFQKLPGSRLSQFEVIDRPALKPLPQEPYAYAEWRKARVGPDYHVAAAGHFYSVPCALARQQVDLRIGTRTIEVFHKSQRVASHRRNHAPGGHTTLADHRPAAHAAFAAWTPERLQRWAQAAGPAVQTAAERLLADADHPEQGLRAGMGLRHLAKRFSTPRLETACQLALANGGISYTSLKAILTAGLDQRPLPQPATPALPAFTHANVRGPQYYRLAQEETSC